MRKLIALVFIILSYNSIHAQCEIPNGDFENWNVPFPDIKPYDLPDLWKESLPINLLSRFNSGEGFFYKYTGADANGNALELRRKEIDLNAGFIRFECDSVPSELKGRYKFSGSSDTNEIDEILIVTYFVAADDTVPQWDLHVGNDPINSVHHTITTRTDDFTDFSINLSSFVNSGETYDYAVIQIMLRAQYAGSQSSATAVLDDLAFEYKSLNTNTNDIERENISIYPNPTNGVLNIQNLGNEKLKSIKVFDVSGRIILEQSDIESSRIDITDKEDGLYIIKVHFNDSSIKTYKILKK